MEHIDYKLSFLDGKEVSGKAKKIVVRDSRNILTLLTQCAPVIAVLGSGKIEIYDDLNAMTDYAYQEGFLNASNNHCTMTILKY